MKRYTSTGYYEDEDWDYIGHIPCNHRYKEMTIGFRLKCKTNRYDEKVEVHKF